MQAELVRDNGLVSCTVTVDAQTVTRAFDAAYEELGASIKLPGFRRGHAPRNIVRGRVNQEELQRSILAEIVPSATQEVMTKYGLEAMDGPSLEDYHLREGDPLVFRFSFVEKPGLTLAEVSELAPDAAGSEEQEPDVDAALEDLRQRQAAFEEKEEPAGEEDVVEGQLEFHREDGNWLIDESARIDLGSERVEKDVREALLGISAGEEREFELKDEEGKPRGKGRAKAARVLKKSVPELNDEFARSVARVETLEQLKARLAEQSQVEAATRRLQSQRRVVFERMVEKSEAQVPVYSTVKLASGILGDLVDSLRARGMSLESLRGEGPNSAEQVFQQALSSAQQRIKEQLVVEELAKRENIQVEASPGEEDDPEAERRRARLLRERVMDWLVERAQTAEPAQGADESQQEQADTEGATDAGSHSS